MTDEKARNITLDELISTASRSTLKTFRELEPQFGDLKVPPKIWIGIWIDPSEIFQKLGPNAGRG